MNVTLTKDADRFLCTIYKEYLIRLDTITRQEAMYFKNSIMGKDSCLSDFNSDDMQQFFIELKSCGFIKVFIGGDFVLEFPAIVYMENRFKNGIKEVVEFIGNLIP